MTKLNDPLGRAFIEFFRSQGVRFIDEDTGEEITVDKIYKREFDEKDKQKSPEEN